MALLTPRGLRPSAAAEIRRTLRMRGQAEMRRIRCGRVGADVAGNGLTAFRSWPASAGNDRRPGPAAHRKRVEFPPVRPVHSWSSRKPGPSAHRKRPWLRRVRLFHSWLCGSCPLPFSTGGRDVRGTVRLHPPPQNGTGRIPAPAAHGRCNRMVVVWTVVPRIQPAGFESRCRPFCSVRSSLTIDRTRGGMLAPAGASVGSLFNP